jgi:hypothetical protein
MPAIILYLRVKPERYIERRYGPTTPLYTAMRDQRLEKGQERDDGALVGQIFRSALSVGALSGSFLHCYDFRLCSNLFCLPSKATSHCSAQKLVNLPAYTHIGSSGVLFGSFIGVLRSPTPVIFALASGLQWFALGSTYWGSSATGALQLCADNSLQRLVPLLYTLGTMNNSLRVNEPMPAPWQVASPAPV